MSPRIGRRMEKGKGRKGREISAADQIEERSNSSPLVVLLASPALLIRSSLLSSSQMASILLGLSVQVVQFWQPEQMRLDWRVQDPSVEYSWKKALSLGVKISF